MTVKKFIEQLSKFDGNAEVLVNRDYIIDCVTVGFGNTVSIESSEEKRAFDNRDDLIKALEIEVITLQQDVDELQAEIEAMEEETND